MSLLHRVQSYDSQAFSRGRSDSIVSQNNLDLDSRPRKLSFSPFPESWIPPKGPDSEHSELLAAEVPLYRRTLQVIIAVIYCLFAAGVVFGFAALKPVLLSEGVYNHLCTPEEIEENVHSCYGQEVRLNLMFTIAAVGTNVAALPIGALLDRYGPRLCGLIGSILLALGSLLFAFAKSAKVDLYIPGYLMLALGGPFIFISSFQLSNAFPKRSGLVLALLTGAFDTSSALFLGYRLVYQRVSANLHLKYFFLAYLIVPICIFIVQLTLMPTQSYKTITETQDLVGHDVVDQDDENTAILRDEEQRAHFHSSHPTTHHRTPTEFDALLATEPASKQLATEQTRHSTSPIIGAMHNLPVSAQISSPWFILITLFTLLQMLRINYFVATIHTQYSYLVSPTFATAINSYFDIALPLGGILSIPFIGTILDRTSTLFVLCTLVTIATTIGVLGILPYTWAAYANVTLFVLYRPFYYTAISDYAAKVFGFETFGTVYGLVICAAGLGNFSQRGLDGLLHGTFGGDPTPINLGLMGVAFLVGMALCGFVAKRVYGFRREDLVEEAEEAEEVRMPAFGVAGER